MAFPKINMASYWSYFVGGVIMLSSFFVTGGTAMSGWTSYAPLSIVTLKSSTWEPLIASPADACPAS